MKRFILYFSIALGFLSCGSTDKKITQAEFERLYAHDSIQSINLRYNDKVARMRIKPFSEKSKTYALPIESVESFQKTFAKLRDKLDAQNIRPSYCIVGSSVPDRFMFIPFIYLIIFLSQLILFLFTVIDILKNRFETATDKLIWFLVVFLLPIIGPILYITIGRKQKLLKQ
jgi:ATP-dependent Zn protease